MNEELAVIASIDPSLLWIGVGIASILISILAAISLRPESKSNKVQVEEQAGEKVSEAVGAELDKTKLVEDLSAEELKIEPPTVDSLLNAGAEELSSPVVVCGGAAVASESLDTSSSEQTAIVAVEEITEVEHTEGIEKVELELPKGTEVKQGLKRSRGFFSKKISAIFGIGKSDKTLDSLLGDFEDILLEGDIGINTTQKLVGKVKAHLLENKAGSDDSLSDQVSELLRAEVISILKHDKIPEIDPVKVDGNPRVVMVVGVNGAGKTTTIGKLAFQFAAQGAKVLVGACDTFRAAAADQLEVWAERAGAGIEKGADGEKPSTVAYRTIHRGKAEGYDVVLIDTAGRLHNKVNLMSELSSITKIVSREQEGAPHETFLVVDGTTGQNALFQAKQFNEATALTGIVITKLDGTPKGGIVVAIKNELGIPVRYIGMGESAGDLRPFEPSEFVDALFTEDEREDLSYSNLEERVQGL